MNYIKRRCSCSGVWIEFVFGRLGVMTTQASWLAQVGRGVLIGQRVLAIDESVDIPRAKSDQLHACRDKWQLAATGFRPTLIVVAHFFSWSPVRLRHVWGDVVRRRSLIIWPRDVLQYDQTKILVCCPHAGQWAPYVLTSRHPYLPFAPVHWKYQFVVGGQ